MEYLFAVYSVFFFFSFRSRHFITKMVLVMYALYYVPMFSVACFFECMLSSTVHVFLNELETCYHWLGAYRTNALYSGHTFVRFNDLEDVFT